MGRRRARDEAQQREYVISTGTARIEPVPAEPDSWVLYVNGVPSSCITLSDPTRLDFEYLDWMARAIDALFGTGQTLRAVHIGAAGCSLARYIDATRPGSRQTAIDIDQKLLEYVREWFDLPRSPALKLRAGDGAVEIATFRDDALSLVVRDAFSADETPGQLADDTFFSHAARTLGPKGIYLANIADCPPHASARGELTRMRQHFAHIVLIADPSQLRGRRFGNHRPRLGNGHRRHRTGQDAARRPCRRLGAGGPEAR
ncbi:spermidine synthase [Brevibacterium sp. UBA7493]|uniref:spermidine synthase n=1 Tax=Brevibacterium sp. UBA7493 TaxID=1946121 RepID=UPI00257BD368|nr:fused MFS/spermidine synthase [Brevibacterium sp. UBA7493]